MSSLSLSLLISNRSHALENLDLDLSPLDPILISCVSPPSPLAHPLGLVRHLLLVAHVRRVDHDNYDDDDDEEEIPPSGSVINIFFYTIEYSAGVGWWFLGRAPLEREEGFWVEKLSVCSNRRSVGHANSRRPLRKSTLSLSNFALPPYLSLSLSLPLFSLSLSVSSFFSTTSNRRLVSYRCVDIIPIQFVRSILSVEGG